MQIDSLACSGNYSANWNPIAFSTVNEGKKLAANYLKGRTLYRSGKKTDTKIKLTLGEEFRLVLKGSRSLQATASLNSTLNLSILMGRTQAH